MCLSPEMACSDASYYIWWDQFHPTDAVNADNVWNGRHSKMCYPFNLEDIVSSAEGLVGELKMFFVPLLFRKRFWYMNYMV